MKKASDALQPTDESGGHASAAGNEDRQGAAEKRPLSVPQSPPSNDAFAAAAAVFGNETVNNRTFSYDPNRGNSSRSESRTPRPVNGHNPQDGTVLASIANRHDGLDHSPRNPNAPSAASATAVSRTASDNSHEHSRDKKPPAVSQAVAATSKTTLSTSDRSPMHAPPAAALKPNPRKWKRRKRGRYTRIAALEDDEDNDQVTRHNKQPQETNHDDHSVKTVEDGTTTSATTNTNSAVPKPTVERANGSVLSILSPARTVRYHDSNNPNSSTDKNADSNRQTLAYPPLPKNQYRVVLRRRAVRKLEEAAQSQMPLTIPSPFAHNTADIHKNNLSDKMDGDNEELYGDTSLGMKLIVVAGKVIVQALNPMTDGKASPAQLAGTVQRGDVLLSIDGFSIVDLPIDQLMEGLRPLSTPDADGAYKRTLDLRFESGVGIKLLENHEQSQITAEGSRRLSGGVVDPANDMFSLFPMVDQLSGAPLFDNAVQQLSSATASNQPTGDKHVSDQPTKKKNDSDAQTEPSMSVGRKANTDSAISESLAKNHQYDRELFTSEFFSWNDETWEWLRSQRVDVSGEPLETSDKDMLTPAERVELGKKTMKLFHKISYSIEQTDKGKDMRSFKLWNSSLSLQSGASRRRRFVLDSVSLPAHRMNDRFERITIEESDEEEDDDESVDSQGSDEEVDGDELLLGLAAHDEIWRRQVIETLQSAIDEMQRQDDDEEEEKQQPASDMNAALTNELGAFLFGKQMTKAIKKKKSYALPPDEVTSVLFDLTTNVATTAPDQITISGQNSSSHSMQSSVGYHALTAHAHRNQDAEVVLATQFLLEQSLPVWLQSFRPLPWEHRRVLWPRVRQPGGGSHVGGGTTVLSDDSLTVDSGETGRTTTKATKSLQERIEDQELDVEARAETCFLVTFYFTQKLLPACSAHLQAVQPTEAKSAISECVSFIQKYGSYLQMQTSLSFAASIRAERIIDKLLELALHDIGHRDASKEIYKGNTLMFYTPAKLSAVMTALNGLRYEMRAERRNTFIGLAVTAYPDVQPWQVRKACLLEDDVTAETERSESGHSIEKQCSRETLKELFYTYLTQLLDPIDGHSHARRNLELIEEYCNMSVESAIDSDSPDNDGTRNESVNKSKLQNFFNIASRASSSHLAYKRDLVMLLDVAMAIKERHLALDLATETIESRDPRLKEIGVLQHLVRLLRELYRQAVEKGKSSEYRSQSFKMLGRIIRLYQRIDHTDQPNKGESIVDVSQELYNVAEMWQDDLPKQQGSCHPRMMELIRFLCKEVEPQYMLRMLALWSEAYDMGPALYDVVQDLLRTGSRSALERELSGSLLRLKYERMRFNNSNRTDENLLDVVPVSGDTQLWRLMSDGALSIDK